VLFSGEGKKVALVAFVGYGAIDQLPMNIKELSVYCWPKPGATNPDGVRRLIKSGVKVYFCDNLHSKVYWTERKGMIVTSANLSANALSSGRQHEYGIYIEQEPALEELLGKLHFRPADEDALAQLDFEQSKIPKSDPEADSNLQHTPSLSEYLATPYPKKFKFAYWSEYRKSNEPIREQLKQKLGRTSWTNDQDVEAGEYEEGDLVLQIHADDEGCVTRANAKWFRVDTILTQRGRHTIIELNREWTAVNAPFAITKEFKISFKNLYNQLNWEGVLDSAGFVKMSFLRQLAAHSEA